MANTLCEIWAALAGNPGDAKAAADARAHVLELLEHVDDCEDCRAISMQVTSPELVFGALAGEDVPLTDEERDLRKRLDAVLATEADDIDSAVDALLADMPLGSETLEKIAPGLTSTQLVSGVNAVNMLVRSFAAQQRNKSIELNGEGLLIGDKLVADRDTIVAEIADLAGVPADAADGMFDWQLVAGDSVERLYRGLVAKSAGPDRLRLKIHHGHAEEPLATRWRRSEVETEPDGDVKHPTMGSYALAAHRLAREIPMYVQEIVSMDQALVLELDRAAATLRTAGDFKLSGLLVDQSRETVVEGKQLVELVAAISREPIQPIVIEGYKKPKFDFIPMGKDRIEIIGYVKGCEMKKKEYFGKIVEASTATAALTPLKQHAAYCMMRADARIKLFEEV